MTMLMCFSSCTETLDKLLHPRITRGPDSLYQQSDARGWLKYLILVPLWSIFNMAIFALVFIPWWEKRHGFEFFEDAMWSAWGNPLIRILLIAGMLSSFVWDVITEAWTFVMLQRGLRRVHHPESLPKLVHAVVVCQYKEPLDVLAATIESLAVNHKADATILCLACEARDAMAEETYETLLAQYGSNFRSFLMTSHVLQPSEIAGKSSNENHAVRELYKHAKSEGLDPFHVMVTVCDADSLFDTVFLDQLEGEFWRMPDGRRCIYDSPINTYRNFPECSLPTQIIEVMRCQGDVFAGQAFRPAQSNYSLTLGFAQEINYWDPTNTAEDMHITLKAMAFTGTKNVVVVRVWSLILNDSVAGFHDRWVQAKRHMWGIEEVVWALIQFPVLRLSRWLVLVQFPAGQMLTVVPLWFLLFFPPVIRVLSSFRPETIRVAVVYFIVSRVFKWFKTCIREVYLYRRILAHRQHMMKMSTWHWARLLVAFPVLGFPTFFIFSTLATWRMLVHAVFHTTLVYVTAPKAFTISTSTVSLETASTRTISSSESDSSLEGNSGDEEPLVVLLTRNQTGHHVDDNVRSRRQGRLFV